jgi:tetratricopeptide (TPR) repeat protein
VDFSANKRTRILICLALALVTLGVYWRVHGFDFLNYDDPDYVTQNDAVKNGLSPEGILWAFTHFRAGNWHPLTWISHMLDVQLFGMHAGAHHIVNVLFHAANAILLFLLLEQLTGARWRSAMVAALFALHPLHVESVAWIAERKDVLSTFFGLLSLIAYSNCVSPPSTLHPRRRLWGAAAIACFALSLLAKPMLVTLPFVLLLLDFWPVRRVENNGWRTFFSPQFFKLAWEKKWWFALAAASCVVTFFAQKAGGAVVSTTQYPVLMRIGNPLHSYFLYIMKACWPVRLAVFYPLDYRPSFAPWLLSAVFLVIVSVAAVKTAKRWPFFLMGWLWFLGTLVPAVGFVQVGKQALADRYTYVPLTGLFIVSVWGISDFLRPRKAGQFIAATVAVVLLGACAVMTFTQLQYWRNSIFLFTRDLAVTRDNDLAHNNLGTELAKIGRKDEAMFHYVECVRIDPNNPHYRINLGTALLRDGRRAAALEQYQSALRADPQFAEAYSNIGALFLAERRLPEALTNMITAVQMDPKNGELHSNLGNIYYLSGRLDDAVAQQLQAIQLDPFSAIIRFNAGIALLKAGRTNDAAIQFAAAVRLNPNSAEARYQLGRQMFLDHRFAGAIENLSAAEQLKPNYAIAQFYESGALAELGRFDEAIVVANHALASAQATGAANLVPSIQEALAAYQSRHAYPSK